MVSPPLHEGTPLALTTAGDVDTLVRAHGTHYIVTNGSGDVAPASARELGLFADDTRYLSHYELSVREMSLVHLSADESDAASNRIDLMVSGVGNDEFLDDPQHFLHVRRRQLVDGAFHERVEIVNYLTRRVDLEIAISFASDFADVFEVRGAKRSRRGTLGVPRVAESSVELDYRGLDASIYVSEVSFAPTPTSLSGHQAIFRLALEAGASSSIAITVDPRPPKRRTPLPASFEEAAREQRSAATRFLGESTRVRCDNAVLEAAFAQSGLDLRALLIDFGAHRVLAAGIPWFSCPFGRDTLLAAYEALAFNPELAASSLRGLAERQGRVFDDFTEEEPGKIFHEFRSGEMAACREIPHSPYYGSVDATPLFVVVAHATYEVTADLELVRDLADPLRAALKWIDRHSESGTSLVTYQRKSPRGLDNQGWKDSRAGVSFPDGRRAVPPIALAEVQGYCVDAYRRGAELLSLLDDPDAAIYHDRAATLARVVDETLWLEDLQRYAFAIDGAGVALPTVVSNAGHLLWSRLPSAERARATADLLVAPASLSAYGVRTLAAGQPVYNPLSYHNGTVWPHDNALIAKGFANYDLMDHACRVFGSLVGAMANFRDHRLPELYCGMSAPGERLVRYPVACSPQAWATAAPFLLLQAVLGIHIDGPRQQLLIRNPRMPESIKHIEIEGMRVGGSRITLRLRRAGHRCHVDRLDVSGAPIRTFVELD
jgi:glycogen debranching enzyme